MMFHVSSSPSPIYNGQIHNQTFSAFFCKTDFLVVVTELISILLTQNDSPSRDKAKKNINEIMMKIPYLEINLLLRFSLELC